MEDGGECVPLSISISTVAALHKITLLCGSGVGHHHHLMLLCVVFGVNWTDVNSSSMMIWKLWLLTSSNLLLWLATNIRILCLYSMHTVDWNLWKSSTYLHPFWIMHLTNCLVGCVIQKRNNSYPHLLIAENFPHF